MTYENFKNMVRNFEKRIFMENSEITEISTTTTKFRQLFDKSDRKNPFFFNIDTAKYSMVFKAEIYVVLHDVFTP